MSAEVNIDNKSMVSRYFNMTDELSQSKSFAKREIAGRLAIFPLIGLEITEMVTNLFHAPSEGFVKLNVMVGQKVFSADPLKKWDEDWHPLQALIKAGKIFLALLSTIVFGLFVPSFNRYLHEKLGLVPALPPVVAEKAEGAAPPAAAAANLN